MAVSTAISLLIFCGAVGKSGQVPLHVWLPDAMEGPTPVSALIHAATMVAAGVFLVARMFPLMSASTGEAVAGHASHTTALTVVTWLGAITAVFAALVAVAQNDIKRILAYSTVSQLGYMMLGLGVGGPAVGMFHLLTHAFFKALLFLGAGSVIHGCDEEQDIRRMGGLRKLMPVTFATYAVGMMALSGVPLLFCGFWSKDEILHSAWSWPVSKGPFALGLFGAFLTAFYMTRQMRLVFFGERWTPQVERPEGGGAGSSLHRAHESPRVMTVPLILLAVCTVLLSIFATPIWPWFHAYLEGHLETLHVAWSGDRATLAVMAASIVVVAVGMALAWRLYRHGAGEQDAVERLQPRVFRLLQNRFFVDEFYEATVLRLNRWVSIGADWLDRFGWSAVVELTALLTRGIAWVSRAFDEAFINLGFDAGCSTTRASGGLFARLQNGQAQRYLRFLAAGVVVLVLALAWMGRR
jgi:NADH-quinone oxidoreductase subunit L